MFVKGYLQQQGGKIAFMNKTIKQDIKELDKDIQRLENQVLSGGQLTSSTENASAAIKNPTSRKMLGIDAQPTFISAIAFYLKRCPNGSDIYKKASYRLFLLGYQKNKNPKCLFGIALCKLFGHGTTQNEHLAKRLIRQEDYENIEKMAEQGDGDSIVIKYQISELGLRITHDSYDNKLKKRLLERASWSASAYAIYFAGSKLHSIELLEKASSMGFFSLANRKQE